MKDDARFKILYVGFDIQSLCLLLREPKFKVSGVNYISDFLTYPTKNISNLLFRKVYSLRFRNTSFIQEVFFLSLFWVLFPFSTSIFRKYSYYLTLLIAYRIPLVDLSEKNQARIFFQEAGLDLTLVNNWWMLPASIVNAPNHGTVNVHPSLLPKYRGSLPTLWSLKNGDSESAVSYMVINAKMDQGTILSQHKFQIDSKDDSIALEEKIGRIIARTLASDLKAYLSGSLKPIAQNHAKASKTEKFHEYMEINWERETAKDIVNKVRLYPHLWPLDRCYVKINGKKRYISSARLAHRGILPENTPPGTVIVRTFDILVQTASGVVRVFRHHLL